MTRSDILAIAFSLFALASLMAMCCGGVLMNRSLSCAGDLSRPARRDFLAGIAALSAGTAGMIALIL